MSYSIDIYRKKLRPTDNFWDFALFVAFFPQLVAGPIERAANLLPKISRPRILTPKQIEEGYFLIAWGLFKKIIIADNIAWIVNETFGHYTSAGSWEIIIALYAFSIQVYCDFSGYSDIARGLAKVMGFELMVNFRLPYFATNMSEFWKRWHISLTSWLRDYLFISIGGSRKGTLRTCGNTIFVLTIVGLWHGANWTFIFWGLYFGIIQAVYIVTQPHMNALLSNNNAFVNRIFAVLGGILVFHIVSFNVLFFRSQDIGQAFQMMSRLFTGAPSSPQILGMVVQLLFFSMPLILMQIAQARSGDLLFFLRLNTLSKFTITFAGIVFIAMVKLFGSHLQMGEEFIYFQF
jgi:D-alanyl-lipoteichoic acid acyltransferase DltB (MBOAT superfamily)